VLPQARVETPSFANTARTWACTVADHQAPSYVVVAQSDRHQPQHLHLALGQPGRPPTQRLGQLRQRAVGCSHRVLGRPARPCPIAGIPLGLRQLSSRPSDPAVEDRYEVVMGRDAISVLPGGRRTVQLCRQPPPPPDWLLP